MALPPEKTGTASQTSEKARERDAAAQETFLREVDDALRQDEMLGFFKRFGMPLALAVGLGLAALAGYLWWDHSRKQAADERSEQFVVALDALEAGDLKGADAKLAPLIAAKGTASASAATLLRAGIALEQGRGEEASRLYAQVAADEGAPRPLRDLATLRDVAARFDAMKPEDVVARLKPMAVPGNAWFGVAGELVGMAYLKQGKPDLAGPLFAGIARDKEVPESLRGRARQMAGVLGVDPLDDVIDETGAATAPSAGQPAPGGQ